MATDFRTFINVVPHICEARFPVLMRGRHGIGKSQVVYQVAKSLERPVVERRASQMTEGDLVGLPVVSGASTKWNPPDWFKFACDNGVVLFFDEVDRATTEVRQGLFELTDSRKLNGHKLHPDTLIFAAVNGGKHGANYAVADMDPAELDRYTVFDLEPTVEDWLTWAKDRMAGEVYDFIAQNPKHLEHNGDVEPNKVYPSRRSWDRLNKTIVKASLLERGASPELYTIVSAFVGMEAAVSFNDFVQNYNKQITVEDVFTGKVLKLADKMEINQHNALIEKIDASGKLMNLLTNEEMDNLAEYFARLPSEIAMVLFKKIAASNEQNAVAFHGRKTSKGDIRDIIVKMLTPA
jgi:midasin (ATPase involved in ribosome maturation)